MLNSGLDNTKKIIESFHSKQKKVQELRKLDLYSSLLHKRCVTKCILKAVLESTQEVVRQSDSKDTLINKIKVKFPSLKEFQDYVAANKSMLANC